MLRARLTSIGRGCWQDLYLHRELFDRCNSLLTFLSVLFSYRIQFGWRVAIRTSLADVAGNTDITRRCCWQYGHHSADVAARWTSIGRCCWQDLYLHHELFYRCNSLLTFLSVLFSYRIQFGWRVAIRTSLADVAGNTDITRRCCWQYGHHSADVAARWTSIGRCCWQDLYLHHELFYRCNSLLTFLSVLFSYRIQFGWRVARRTSLSRCCWQDGHHSADVAGEICTRITNYLTGAILC